MRMHGTTRIALLENPREMNVRNALYVLIHGNIVK